MVGVTDVNPKVRDRLSTLARRRILIEARHDKLRQRNKERREAIKTVYDRMVNRIEAQAAKVDDMLWRAIDKNRDQLIPGGKRSFTTRWVKFQFKNVPATTKVKDEAGIVSVARKRGALKKVANPTWVVDDKKLLAYLDENPDERKHYQDHLEEIAEHETLSIKLNEGHDVTFDNKRLTPKAVSVQKNLRPASE